MSIFEAGMLICFGASWPFAVAKIYKTKSVEGQSRLFLILVLVGYVLGVLHKILFSMDIVIWLYIFNAVFVALDLALVYLYRNR